MDKGDGNVRYVLTGDGAGTLFLIDEKSGDIHATKRLDREEKAMYTLNAKVLDRNTNAELEPDTEFNIKIHDINDNEPKFSKEIYFASVPEMSDVGELIVETTSYTACVRARHSLQGLPERMENKKGAFLLFLHRLISFVGFIRHSVQRKPFGI